MSASPCGAKTRSGGTCKLVAGHGTDHVGWGSCKFHGGSTTNGRTGAARQAAKAEAARLGAEAPVTADEALELAIKLVGGEVQWLQRKVRELKEEDIDADDLPGIARALSAASERLARVAKLGVDANLEGRRLELDSLVLDRLGAAVAAAIADANLDEDARARLDGALRRRLSELSDEDLRPVPRELPA